LRSLEKEGKKNINLDGHFQPLFPDDDDSVCLVFIHFTFFLVFKKKKERKTVIV
jgi:hypothetical protein